VSGYLSHSLIPLYFGLADTSVVDSVFVKWPSGKNQKIDDIEMGKILEIVEIE